MKTAILISIVPFVFLINSCRENESAEKNPVKAQTVQSYADEIGLLYRIELLPQYRDHSEIFQVSSYDTTGGNNDGFSGLYSYIRKEGNKRIIAELQGPGVIERIWTPTPSEDTIQFYFDGETEPRISLRFIDLFTGDHFPFINPIVGNEVGGYYSYLPIPYEHSCRIVYIGEALYFHQIQYRKFMDPTGIKSFRMELSGPERSNLMKASELWAGGKNVLDAHIDTTYRNLQRIVKTFTIAPGETIRVADINEAGRIVKFLLETPDVPQGALKNLLIRIHWDDEQLPAVNSPAADFFGYAYGKPAAKSLLLGHESGMNYCYHPMPFDKNAEVDVVYATDGTENQPVLTLTSNIGVAPVGRNPEWEGKFYTHWKRMIDPPAGEPYVIQETSGKGHHVGTILQARGLQPGMTIFFEGDDSTLVDHALRIHGTGSEDYFNGGWYALPNRWDRAFSLPIHGCLEYSIPLARTGGYRFYLTDKINFRQHLLHTIEHGPEGNRYPVDYTSVAFYYCDRPPEQMMEPQPELRKIYYPDTLVITTDLMKITVGLFNATGRTDWRKFRFHGEKNSLMVIHLDEIPPGKYSMFLSYYQSPQGCDFSVWQRQQRVSGILSAGGGSEEPVEDFYIGEIVLNDQYQSVSIMKETSGEAEELVFSEMMFVRVPSTE